MSSTRLPNRALVVDTIRLHRWGMVAWVVGAVVAMAAVAAGFASEVARFPGGAGAMAASLEAGVQAMRPLRWPAERLDTLGGYLTYHNVVLFVLALSVYAAVQGANAVRGVEAKGMSAVILASGRSRPGVVLDRAAGFALTLTVICLGLGTALAVAMATGGEPDPGGSFITAFAAGMCALTAYGLGLLVSQLTPSARSGTAVSTLLLAGLYVLTNVADEVGPVGAVRFVSPFYYVNFSRALVPGHGLDLLSILGLATMTLLMLAAAAWAFQRRDYAAGLWTRRPRPAGPVRRAQRLNTIWAATLVRQRLGLLAWAAAAAATLALMAWLEPAVADLWDEFSITQAVIASDPSRTITDQYLAFAGQLVVPIVTAFVIAQAAGWVNDLHQGRVELLLAGPVSWPRLVWQRLLATLLGAAGITLAAIAGLAVTATVVGVSVDPSGLVRLAGATVLLSAALAAVAALVVAWLRSAAAVTVLAIFVAASYLLVYLVPLFAWPAWIARTTVFGAYGNPYVELPAWTGLTVLAALTAAGGIGAAAIAQRSPKVAT